MSQQQVDAVTPSQGHTEQSDFMRLIEKEFKPRTEEAKTEVDSAIQTLAQQALLNTNVVADDAIQTIEALITQIDDKLNQQVNEIIHHQQFQELEGAWRGLHYLVNNSDTDQFLKIRYLNITKAEISKQLKRYKGAAWDQSPLFKKIYEVEYGQFGGEPYGCLVGDYYFDYSPQDVEALGEIAKISAAAHVPFLSSVSPSAFQMDSWSELSNPRDIGKIFSTPDYAAWRALRESEDSKYVGLSMPRFMARQPYGAKSNPVEEFAFEEDIREGNQNSFVWANSAYAMATNVNRSFKDWGWCSRIRGVESGGAVPDLPTYTYPTDDGGVDMACPTEVAISDRREAELSQAGFLPLIHKKNSNMAAFIGAQSLHKPAEYEDADASANAKLAARLPYLFATCRFAHYLKCIVRDKVGSFRERHDMQRWLQDWIMQYVDGDPANSSEAVKATRPLADAEVVVEEIEDNPGMYTSKFYLRPHYQLEGLTVSLRLVSKLPSGKGDN